MNSMVSCLENVSAISPKVVQAANKSILKQSDMTTASDHHMPPFSVKLSNDATIKILDSSYRTGKFFLKSKDQVSLSV